MRLELRDILVTTVLNAAIRMMDGSAQVAATGLANGLLQSLNGVLGFQSRRQNVADHHARESVRYKMQITKLIIYGVDIRYIAHPQLINICNNEFFDKIWILKVDVVRVSSVMRFARRDDQLIPVKQVQKLVSSHIQRVAKHRTSKIVQFETAYQRHLCPVGCHNG